MCRENSNRWILTRIALVVLCLVCVGCPPAGVVVFPDANLDAAIRSAIGKPTGDILATDLAGTGFTWLWAKAAGITDLTGLEYCTDLTYLNLSSNQISDISAVVANPGIDNGDWVDIQNNPLDQDTLCIDIPMLEERGVYVEYDGVCGGSGGGAGCFGGSQNKDAVPAFLKPLLDTLGAFLR